MALNPALVGLTEPQEGFLNGILGPGKVSSKAERVPAERFFILLYQPDYPVLFIHDQVAFPFVLHAWCMMSLQPDNEPGGYLLEKIFFQEPEGSSSRDIAVVSGVAEL